MPAYNEAAGIGRILSDLLGDPDFGSDIEVIVAANGCTDDTADVARSYGVRVIDIATPSKTAAFNAADAIATGDVLIYQDADIPVTAALLRQLAAAVAEPGIEAAVPGREIDASGSAWPVRAFYAINGRLPVFSRRLFGRGVIALSREARSRFDRFPEITADDMFLDAIVAASEKAEVATPVRVGAPKTSSDLVRRVARARDGNAEFWRYVDAGAEGHVLALDPVAGPNQWAWLGSVVRRKPALLPSAVCYAGIVALAEAKRRSPGWDVKSGWGRPAAPIPRQRSGAHDETKVREK
ncbi:glycosyltransferase [Actinoplanes sp. NPDC023714]|uniref:glycosyltransferase n=1 Tax=Actinoplanes sp. NPDC023714 TaxID=3154322 RepID=UPI0033F57BE4